MQRRGQLSRHDQRAGVVPAMRAEQRGVIAKQRSIARRNPVAAMLAGYNEGIARRHKSPGQFGEWAQHLMHSMDPSVAAARRRAYELYVAHDEYYPAAPRFSGRPSPLHSTDRRRANTTAKAKGPMRMHRSLGIESAPRDFGVSPSACALRLRASARRHPSSCRQACPTQVLNLGRAAARSSPLAPGQVAADWAMLPVAAIAVAAASRQARAQVSWLALRAARQERPVAAASSPAAVVVAASRAPPAQVPALAEIQPAFRPAVAMATPSVQAARQAVRVVPHCQAALAFHAFPEPARP